MSLQSVAPFTGAWIEIPPCSGDCCAPCRSLPSRERGLKFFRVCLMDDKLLVAPFTGAWIEICGKDSIATWLARRSLHGSVD